MMKKLQDSEKLAQEKDDLIKQNEKRLLDFEKLLKKKKVSSGSSNSSGRTARSSPVQSKNLSRKKMTSSNKMKNVCWILTKS